MAGTEEDENHFTPPEVVSNYLERHFRRGLSKKECSAMLKKDPKSNTPAGAPPEVDPYILTFWKISQLKHLQTALLYTAGPLAGLWSQIVEQELHKDPEALIQVPIVLEALQRAVVFLGNANVSYVTDVMYKYLRPLTLTSPSMPRETRLPRCGKTPIWPHFSKGDCLTSGG